MKGRLTSIIGSRVASRVSSAASTFSSFSDSPERQLQEAFSAKRHKNIIDVSVEVEADVGLKGGGSAGIMKRVVSYSKDIPVVEKPQDVKDFIEYAIKRNVLFSDLTEEQLEKVIGSMSSEDVKAGESLIVQGDEGEEFFVVDQGSFVFTENGEEVGTSERGGYFGELALIYNCPRTRSVIAKSDAKVWTLDRMTYRKIMASSVFERREEAKRALEKVPLLQELNSQDFEQLVDYVERVKFKKDEAIIKKGELGQILYFVSSGQVLCSEAGEGGMVDLELGPGDYFGERALLTNRPRAANVYAQEDSELLALDREIFENVFGTLKELLDRNLGLRILKSIPLLNTLESETLEVLFDRSYRETYAKGETIVRRGEKGKSVYIIEEGTIRVQTKRDGALDNESVDVATVADASAGEYFGESALVGEIALADVVAASAQVIVRALDVTTVKSIIESGKLMNKVEKNFEERRNNTLQAEVLDMEFNDLEIFHTLGTGTFGRVKLVEHKQSKQLFALKIITKSKVIQYEQKRNVFNEKMAMVESDHPFILKLIKTFKDAKCLYMLIELVPGGELFSLMRKLRKKTDARFYMACVILAFEYMHNKRIIYRDLKPENLLLDADGYIKVVDFGFAKRVKTKTFTMCGTPDYMAPEVLLRKGYDKSVDYWAVGIVYFELIFGFTPFGDNFKNDYVVVCKNIIRGNLQYPSYRGGNGNFRVRKTKVEDKKLITYKRQRKLIKEGLLLRDPRVRLGMRRDGVQAIKDQPVFEGLDWEKLARKELPAPWKPKMKNEKDMGNFMAYPEDFDAGDYVDDGTGWDDSF